MKYIKFLSLFAAILVVTSCDNEPLEGDFPNSGGSSGNSQQLVGEWELVNFVASVNTTSTFQNITTESLANVFSTDVDYSLTFGETTFATEGSYTYNSELTLDDQDPIIQQLMIDDVNGNGTYTATNNEITTSESFFEFMFQGNQEIFEGPQTTPYTISNNGNTLTFSQNSIENIDEGGFVSSSMVTSTSIWSKVNDDDDTPNENVDLPGTWKLTAWNGTEPIDLNNDGTESINFLDEMDCYNNETIVFNTNNTGVSMSTSFAEFEIEIETGTTNSFDFTVTCIDEIENTDITWSQSGNTVSITDAFGTSNWTLAENTLSILVPEGFSVTNSEDVTITTTQDLTFVYTKQ